MKSLVPKTKNSTAVPICWLFEWLSISSTFITYPQIWLQYEFVARTIKYMLNHISSTILYGIYMSRLYSKSKSSHVFLFLFLFFFFILPLFFLLFHFIFYGLLPSSVFHFASFYFFFYFISIFFLLYNFFSNFAPSFYFLFYFFLSIIFLGYAEWRCIKVIQITEHDLGVQWLIS